MRSLVASAWGFVVVALGGGHAASLSDAAFVPETCPALSDENYFYVGIF